MWNSRTNSNTSFRMRRLIFLFLLLTQWAESSQDELLSQKEKHKEKRERVLIRSKRGWKPSTPEMEMEEENPGPFPQILTALYNNVHQNNSVRFHLSGQGVTEEPMGVFSIDSKTSTIYVHKPVDRETYPNLTVSLLVEDLYSGDIIDESLAFSVMIRDKNDNPPVFIHKILYAQLPENTREGVLSLSLQVIDSDEKGNDNSRISMRIVSQYPASPKFSLNRISTLKNTMISNLFFTGCFDYDKVKAYKILVEARDHGNPSHSSTATVNVAITDANTHAPVFLTSTFTVEVMEMETNKEILRIPVQDQDTGNTSATRAVFTILKGNEDGSYKIETDPATNEGVLTVIKGKDYETATLTELEIGVDNEEPLFFCVNGKPVSHVPQINMIKVSVKIINVNEPPVFQNKIQTVYRIEEEKPGDMLYTPTVTDVDSDTAKLRYELIKDPAKWVSIDPKTGNITVVKKMDRESSYVHNSIYTVMLRAIDDGQPPGTGTGTLMIYLGDKNDNAPRLTSKALVMCGNKADKVRVTAEDADAFPYGGPFTFTLDGDQKLMDMWKLETSIASETTLISLKTLPYGNYSVPLKIADQQGVVADNVLQVVLCDCGRRYVCLSPQPRSTRFYGAIGILLGLLLTLAASRK